MSERWPAEERLWRHIMAEPNSGCWLWDGYCCPKGYGQTHFKGKSARAHRTVYELYKGPIPSGLTLDHLCRVRCCVNPAHLEPVTLAENIRRGEGFGVVNARKTHCPRNHPLSGQNLIVTKRGRRCRVCQLAANRRYEARVREAALAKYPSKSGAEE